MKVAIGLPNAVPLTSGEDLIGFARAAEEQGFSSLGTIDRIVYGNHEPLAALAAAAAVTSEIGLLTSVMLGPLRNNAVQTAKQALTRQRDLRRSADARHRDRRPRGRLAGIRRGDVGRASAWTHFWKPSSETFADESDRPRQAAFPRS